MLFSRDLLRVFVERALRSNTSYYTERKRLLAEFTSAIDPSGDIEVSHETVVQIRLYLQSRNNTITNNSRLAFEVGVLKIAECVAP